MWNSHEAVVYNSTGDFRQSQPIMLANHVLQIKPKQCTILLAANHLANVILKNPFIGKINRHTNRQTDRGTKINR